MSFQFGSDSFSDFRTQPRGRGRGRGCGRGMGQSTIGRGFSFATGPNQPGTTAAKRTRAEFEAKQDTGSSTDANQDKIDEMNQLIREYLAAKKKASQYKNQAKELFERIKSITRDLASSNESDSDEEAAAQPSEVPECKQQ